MFVSERQPRNHAAKASDWRPLCIFSTSQAKYQSRFTLKTYIVPSSIYTSFLFLSEPKPFPIFLTLLSAMAYLLLALISFVLHSLVPKAYSYGHAYTCRSYCGNLTIDYPFALQPGCGHQGYRELMFCINNVLMFHIPSGSYRVLNIDYAYSSLTLDEPHMSTCMSIMLGKRGNGFVVEPWREPYLSPMVDNVFMLLHCKGESPLFQGFSGKHLPCRNVAGMGCDDYLGCPAWSLIGPYQAGSVYGSGPPKCCAVAYDEAIKDINLTRLGCQGYSSAYNLAPLRLAGPDEWSYGIRLKYSVQGNETFCKACEATGGSCGYDINDFSSLCLCGSWNSTSNCDSVPSASHRKTCSFMEVLTGIFIYVVMIWKLTTKLGV